MASNKVTAEPAGKEIAPFKAEFNELSEAQRIANNLLFSGNYYNIVVL